MKHTKLGVYKEEYREGPCGGCKETTNQVIALGPPKGEIFYCNNCIDNLFGKKCEKNE